VGEVPDGESIMLPFDYLAAGHLTHAYAMTVLFLLPLVLRTLPYYLLGVVVPSAALTVALAGMYALPDGDIGRAMILLMFQAGLGAALVAGVAVLEARSRNTPARRS
jgi:hypothetical protein